MNNNYAKALAQFYSETFVQPCFGFYDVKSLMFVFIIGTNVGNLEVHIPELHIINETAFKTLSRIHSELRKLMGKEE